MLHDFVTYLLPDAYLIILSFTLYIVMDYPPTHALSQLFNMACLKRSWDGANLVWFFYATLSIDLLFRFKPRHCYRSLIVCIIYNTCSSLSAHGKDVSDALGHKREITGWTITRWSGIHMWASYWLSAYCWLTKFFPAPSHIFTRGSYRAIHQQYYLPQAYWVII